MATDQKLNGAVIEITEDRTWKGPKVAADGLIKVGSANVWVMANFLSADLGRGEVYEWMLTRFYSQGFIPGKQVVFDGRAGEKGSAVHYDPFWEPGKGRENKHIKPVVRRRRTGADGKSTYVEDAVETQKLTDRINGYVSLLADAQDQEIPVIGRQRKKRKKTKVELADEKRTGVEVDRYIHAPKPEYWGSVRHDDIPHLKFNVPAIMQHARAWAKNEMHGGRRISCQDGFGFNTALHAERDEDWTNRWKSYAGSNTSDASDFTVLRGFAECFFKQMLLEPEAQPGYYFFPLELLSSTEHVDNVYIRKMPATVFKLDRRVNVYNRIASERSTDAWIKSERAQREREGRELSADRVASILRARQHASALVWETPVVRQQLWFAKGRCSLNNGITASYGMDRLRSWRGSTSTPRGVDLAAMSSGSPLKGGLEP